MGKHVPPAERGLTAKSLRARILAERPRASVVVFEPFDPEHGTWHVSVLENDLEFALEVIPDARIGVLRVTASMRSRRHWDTVVELDEAVKRVVGSITALDKKAIKRIRWEDVPLGRLRDVTLAKQLGVSPSTVRTQRLRRGLPAYDRRGKPVDETLPEAERLVEMEVEKLAQACYDIALDFERGVRHRYPRNERIDALEGFRGLLRDLVRRAKKGDE